jgi:hypothetical protein
VTPDANGPVHVSSVCRECHLPVTVEDKREGYAVALRDERDDGKWGIQWNHGDDECPQVLADRINDNHPRFVQQSPR